MIKTENWHMKKSVGNLSIQSDFIVISFVVAMGSNHDVQHAFMSALKELRLLGKLTMSVKMVGLDVTGKTDLIYHNACAKIELHEPMSLMSLNERLKHIEMLCGRNSEEALVAMDLDILAVFDGDVWQISHKRLPFKPYERVGLLEVADFLL